jgi:cell division GTPase FtsZ
MGQSEEALSFVDHRHERALRFGREEVEIFSEEIGMEHETGHGSTKLVGERAQRETFSTVLLPLAFEIPKKYGRSEERKEEGESA